MMKKAREEKKAAEEAARRERGEPEPTEPGKLNDEEELEAKLEEIQKKEKAEKEPGIVLNTWDENMEIVEKAESGATVEELVEEKTIDTRENKSDDEEEELPPSLEQVSTE